MFLAFATTVAAALAFLIVIARRRRLSFGELLQLIGQVPARPGAPGLQWMFIGRFDPPDPDPRKTSAVYVDERPDPSPPPGLRRIEKFD
jgi:hypothetical protein